MKLEQISSWISYQEMNSEVHNELIKSWLLEEGPITSRIKSNEVFELNLLKDCEDEVERFETDFLGKNLGKVKTREVILLGNKSPRVFARSLIPLDTINHGFSKLGDLGTKPLGDILFEKRIFRRVEIVFAKFADGENIFWGRKTKYLVKDYPLSVMEVFLIDANG